MDDISTIQRKYQERVGTEAITRENQQLWSDLGATLRRIEELEECLRNQEAVINDLQKSIEDRPIKAVSVTVSESSRPKPKFVKKDLTWEKVHQMRLQYMNGTRIPILARDYKVSRERARRIVKNLIWEDKAYTPPR